LSKFFIFYWDCFFSNLDGDRNEVRDPSGTRMSRGLPPDTLATPRVGAITAIPSEVGEKRVEERGARRRGWDWGAGLRILGGMGEVASRLIQRTNLKEDVSVPVPWSL
jgi:hypothetical protein